MFKIVIISLVSYPTEMGQIEKKTINIYRVFVDERHKDL